MIGVFFAIGMILIIGFTGNLLFDRTKIPESFFLMLTGIVLGPVLGVMTQAQLISMSSLFATFALIIVLMEGGINLDIFGIMRDISEAGLFTLLSTTLSITASFFLLKAFGYETFQSLLMATAIGGTTSITVIHLMEKMKLPQKVKDILTMESVLTDVLLLTAVILMLQFYRSSSLGISDVASELFSQISIAFLVGFVVALAWSYFMAILKKNQLIYVSTLGIAFILYDFVQYVGGNGPIAVLVFSLFLGNITRLANQLKRKTVFSEIKKSLLKSLKSVEREFSFFIKTFFFVYIGMLVSPAEMDVSMFYIALSLVGGMVASRFLSAWVFSKIEPEFRSNIKKIALSIPRGFSSILITILLLDSGITIKGMTNIVVSIVFLSTIVPMVAMKFLE